MSPPLGTDIDVERLKKARQSPAVLKTKLANFRSGNPETLVFAFEGDTDNAAYSQWVRRLRGDLVYEPFPCGGKGQALGFREMLRRDLGDLAKRVYFFIDRDFDEYRGYAPEPETTFMTDQYSIENYLVTREVLEELLKDEFYCHAEPEVRKVVSDCFEARLAEFLTSTMTINFRLFVARKKGFELKRHLPSRINSVATVTIDSVSEIAVGPEQIVVFEEQVDVSEYTALRTEFDALDPRRRYRGKFNLLFFMKWLELLAADRKADTSVHFSKLAQPKGVNTGAISIGMLASKSATPNGLEAFLATIH